MPGRAGKRLSHWVVITAFLITLAGFFYVVQKSRYTYEKPDTIKYRQYRNFGVPIPAEYEIIGIDVSRYQKQIKWEWVDSMRDESGRVISFVFLKATQGKTYRDPFYTTNKEVLKNKNLAAGAYHFFDPTVDGQLQALHFIKTAQLQKGDLLPVIDVEITNGVSDKLLQKELLRCLDVITRWYNQKPIIYTNVDFYTTHLQPYFDEYPLWIAHYYTRKKPRINRSWAVWQLSDKATISGILGGVDINVLPVDAENLELIQLKHR